MFQRMVALPYDEYAQMNVNQKLQQVKQPNDVQFNTLDRQYEERASIPDQYRRMFLQGETLDEMKMLKEKMRNVIASNSPKPYRQRASALFDGLESFMRFNERGEIFDDANKVVPNSHVQDLIQYAVRDRRRNVVPAGWNEFKAQLKIHNVPRHMLNRFTLDELEGKKTSDAAAPSQAFIFKTPAQRQMDQRETVVKRPQATKRVQADNPFDVLKGFGSPSPKKPRKRPHRSRKQPEKFGFTQSF